MAQDKKGKLRAAIAGTGWGEVHASGFAGSEHAEVCAIWSRTDKPESRAMAKRFGVELFTDYQKMLETIKPEVVGVAVPEAMHAPLTLAALDAGAHVHCEKVMSDSRESCVQMIRRARDKKRLLNIGYNYRYSPSCIYLREAVQAGKLGTLVFAQLRAFTWCVHHMTDYATSLLGKPVRVTGVFERGPIAGKALISPAVLAFPTFVYAAFGRKAYMVEYEGGAVLQASATDYTALAEPGATLIVQGTEGRAELDDLSGQVTIFHGTRESTVYRPSQICDSIGLRENGVSAVKDFARAIAAGEAAPVPGEAGLAMLCLEEAIFKAAEGRKWVEVELPR